MLTLRPVINPPPPPPSVSAVFFRSLFESVSGRSSRGGVIRESSLVLAHHLLHSAPPHSETRTLCRADVCTSCVLDETHCLGSIWCYGGSLMTLSCHCSCKALARSDWGLVYTHLGHFSVGLWILIRTNMKLWCRQCLYVLIAYSFVQRAPFTKTGPQTAKKRISRRRWTQEKMWFSCFMRQKSLTKLKHWHLLSSMLFNFDFIRLRILFVGNIGSIVLSLHSLFRFPKVDHLRRRTVWVATQAVCLYKRWIEAFNSKVLFKRDLDDNGIRKMMSSSLFLKAKGSGDSQTHRLVAHSWVLYTVHVILKSTSRFHENDCTLLLSCKSAVCNDHLSIWVWEPSHAALWLAAGGWKVETAI